MNINKKNNSKFLLQGSILAIAGIFVRLIGLFYRIPMINIIGTKGNGYYTSAYNLYSLLLILSSYSFPVAISKILSEKIANKRFIDMKKTISISFIFALIVGIFMFAFLFFLSDGLSILLQKRALTYALKALAPTLFIMTFLGVLRGVFQGTGSMIPTAVSQIIEQIFNAIFSIVFAILLFDRGLIANILYNDDKYSYAFGAAGGAIGTGIGALSALIFLFILFNIFYRQNKKYFTFNNNYKISSNVIIIKSIIFTVIPIILASAIYNFTSIIDDFVFSNILSFKGYGEQIVEFWGVFGQYHLLFNIPVAISNCLTSSIIPSLSSSVELRDAKAVVLKIKYSFKYTILIVIPSFLGFTILSRPICDLLFRNSDNELLSKVLIFGSFAIVTFSLSTITNGILHALSKMKKTFMNNLYALILHIIILIILLFLNLNLYAVIISNILFALIVFLLNIRIIFKIVKFKKNYFNDVIMPFICGIIMSIVVLIIYNILSKLTSNISSYPILVFKVLISILVGSVIYIFLLVLFRVVRKRDCEYIPFLSILKKFLR